MGAAHSTRNPLDVVRCTSRTLTPEANAELTPVIEPSGPSCGRIDELDELLPVRMAPALD